MRFMWDVGLLVLGSDFFVELLNFFEGVYVVVMRKSLYIGIGLLGWEGGWYKEQEGLSVWQVFDGFIRGFVYVVFWEKKVGVIREGGFVDWVVMDEDVLKIGEEEIRFLKVREIWVVGKKVYFRDGEDELVVEK